MRLLRSHISGIMVLKSECVDDGEGLRKMKSARHTTRWPVWAGTLLVIAGVFSLSTASRRPYLSDTDSAWHISKASKMSKSVFSDSDRWLQSRPVEIGRATDLSILRASPSVVQEGVEPPISQIDPRNHHFRSPPTSC
jgi:hypothetical protein